MTHESRDDMMYISLEEWYDEYALEIELADDQAFLKIKETLSRIGVCPRDSNKLYQTCHILQKRGKFYIVHFKELFALDGREVNLSKSDIRRRNRIAVLIEEWELATILEYDSIEDEIASVSSIKIIKHADVPQYELVPKYNIGSH